MNRQSYMQRDGDNCGERHEKFRPGYGYVPVQRGIGKVYSPQKALAAGTIFPELNITIGEYERGLFDGK